ncbi:hypothetical protein INR49_000071 [Caranx melampygus]|nr:hypothetical protein INR49_000071 [Caranx melampygus]
MSSVAGLDSELEESEVQTVVEVQDLLAEQDILERENETAVLHLQSAEEQERREREEAEGEAVQQELGTGGLAEQPLCLLPGALGAELPEQAEVPGVEQVLLQGPFPTGATVLCITDNQEESPSDLLRDSTSLLYYQLSPIEPGAFETLPRAEEAEQEERSAIEPEAGGGECGEGKQAAGAGEEPKDDKPEKITCRQSLGKSLTDVILCSEECVAVAEEKPSSCQQSLPEERNRTLEADDVSGTKGGSHQREIDGWIVDHPPVGFRGKRIPPTTTTTTPPHSCPFGKDLPLRIISCGH